MPRRLPPLHALRAFEAAARHLSFTLAAEELHVTQAAISHQVKALEQALGTRLFDRRNRSITLTPAGRAYLPPVREALDAISIATERVRAFDSSGPLRVSVLPSFASKWLLPRLSRFRARHPEIDVLISARAELVDFTRDEADLGIRYGSGRYPGLSVIYLMAEQVFPVCSPALGEGNPPLRELADLRHHTLLHTETGFGPYQFEDWRLWLEAMGVRGVDAGRGPGFSDAALMLQAAIEGQGVALGRRSLCADDLASGRLVRPFRETLTSRASYYVVAPPARASQAKVHAFCDWLVEETAAERLAYG